MKFILQSKEIMTPTVRAFTFEPAADFVFQAGQFVMFKRVGEENKFARAFSMASGPLNHENLHVTFIMKHIPDGNISGFLETAPEGAELEASAPLGRFTLHDIDTDRVFIATGTGLAPIISFIEAERSAPSGVPFHTVFGVRNEEELYWTEKLPDNSLITLSRPSETWAGEHGRVTEHLPRLIAAHPAAAWYICGSPDMVKEVRATLITAGIPVARIHFEIY